MLSLAYLVLPLFIVWFAGVTPITAQQDSICLTQPVPYYLPSSFSMGDDCFEGPFTLRVYLHIVRNVDGSGGISVGDAMDCLDVLNEDFEDHNISFFTDCEPDEIRFIDQYSTNDLVDVWPEAVKHDGINIFLFPSNVNANTKGVATPPGFDDYPSVSVAGNFKIGYTGHTHVISHEVGHVLGLYHTSDDLDLDTPFDCFENYPGEGSCGCSGPCEYDGDLICDTYPDPYDDGYYDANCVFHPEVYENGSASSIEDGCDVTFPIPDVTTPVTNIMSLWEKATSGNCWAGGVFTFCQGLKMRKVVEEYGPTHGFLADPNPAFQTYTISTPGITNWTQENVNGLIYVEAEAVLTITDRTVCFTPESAIIVKRGGKLIVDNSTLTAQCMDKWKGIEVWGNGASAQVDDNGTLDETTNGVVVIRNGSVIREALTGVRCGTLIYGYKAPFGKGNPFYFDLSLGGGYLKASESTFEENNIAIHFGNYDKYFENQSVIEDCEISYDGPPLSGNLLPAGVKIEGTGEIEISGTSFTGQSMLGVDMLDGMVIIHEECSFNTPLGVDAYGTTPSAGWVDIKGAPQAPNTFVGKRPIQVRSLDLGFGTRIVYNSITNQYEGIVVAGPSAVQISRNQIGSTYESGSGIWMKNANLSNSGNVFCNTITQKVRESIQCQEDNSLLLMYRNQLTVEEEPEFGDPLSAIVNIGKIFNKQAYKESTSGNDLPVGNVFSTPAEKWISNSGGEHFDYYVPQSDPNGNLIPPVVDNYENKTLFTNPPNCSSIPDPIGTPDEEEREALLELRDSLWAEWSGTYTDSSALYAWAAANRAYLAQFQAQEQVAWANRDTSGLMALWAESAIPGQWKTFGYRAQSGDVSGASTMLNTLLIPYPDTAEFRTLQAYNLQRLNQDTSFFTVPDSIWVDQVARSLSPNAGYARGLLHAIYDWRFMPNLEAEPRSSSDGGVAVHAGKKQGVCYPTFLNGSVNLKPCLGGQFGEEYMFIMVNAQGQFVSTYSGSSPVVSVGSIPTGMYYFRLTHTDSQISGKIWVP